MRRLIPAVILAVFLVSVCVAANVITVKCCDRISALVDKYETAFDKGDKVRAGNNAEELCIEWEKRKRLLSVFSAHDLLDKISYSTSRLKGFAKTYDEGNSSAECGELKRYLEQLKEEQRFSGECFY